MLSASLNKNISFLHLVPLKQSSSLTGFIHKSKIKCSFLSATGKFKSGIKNFNTSLQPISAKELKDLLSSKDYEGVIGKDDTVISEADLKSLLDRSDLIQLQKERGKSGERFRFRFFKS